jgi:hypothetical protein
MQSDSLGVEAPAGGKTKPAGYRQAMNLIGRDISHTI